MSSQCFLRNMTSAGNHNLIRSVNDDSKPPINKEKVMSYEEKSVGSTSFFQCEACPYMALAEDDIKFHLFTVHPDLAKKNGLADNIHIPCPGCTCIPTAYDTEESLRNHLRSHHKMGIKDVKKMVKSLIQIALKDAKLKKEGNIDSLPSTPVRQEMPDLKMPRLIEIGPDINAKPESLPKGVAFISVDELQKMSTPNFEQIDPKEIIQEASINIVYSNDMLTQYVNVNDVQSSSNSCNLLQVSSVTPDLISSIKPRVDNHRETETEDNQHHISPSMPKSGRPKGYISLKGSAEKIDIEKQLGLQCSVDGCHVRLKNDEKLRYHSQCHRNGLLQCPECNKVCSTVEPLHTHLWKKHAVDMELPTCEICGYKTYTKHRLYNIHMKIHGKIKAYTCLLCLKAFKSPAQLSKHKTIHNRELNPVKCPICQRNFNSESRMKAHKATVHDKLKPFKCDQCDYTAGRKEELKLHSRSHTGVKPYSCDQCTYRAADHNAMRRHKKQHSKENIYKCKYCPYTAIQSTLFASHMISRHPNISSDIYRCPYCPFKSVSKDKYILHLTTHTDKEGIQLLIDMQGKSNKPSWTIPSTTESQTEKKDAKIDEESQITPKNANPMSFEVYDCDSISESLPQDYSKGYCSSANDTQTSNFLTQDLSKEDNNSDCLISESSNDILLDNVQYNPSHSLQDIVYDNNKPGVHDFLSNPQDMDPNLLANNKANSLAISHPPSSSNINNNIMNNFPIRLPPSPHMPNICKYNVTLKPVDKISLPIPKVSGPNIIKSTQILPVLSSSNSPVNICNDTEGLPRKKPKISVKSNLILKGPDEINMFHSQQKMAFKRLEDNERFGLSSPVTFNNLITTHSFMQLQAEPTLSESPSNILTYPQEKMLVEVATTPEDSSMADDSQMFSFNQQLNVNPMAMLPPPQKIQTSDPNFIKIEATIKQNTQSPSLESMCNANLMNAQAVSREYKASPPLEDLHKNIKNEVKSDGFYIPLNNSATNPSIIDQYLMDNIIGEQYQGHVDLSTVVIPEATDDQQNDVIEIDDNSDDNKLLPRFDMNFPLESYYLIHNDFHFLDNDIVGNLSNEPVSEMNRMVTEVPIMTAKENSTASDCLNNEFLNFNQGKKDLILNTSVRPNTNKINVKNIELMKN